MRRARLAESVSERLPVPPAQSSSLEGENRMLLDELAKANEKWEARMRETTKRLRQQNKMLREAHQRAEALSRKDSLTGLATRGWLDETLAQEVERSRRYGSPLSLVMGDLDHFKAVNDAFGHQVGDKVLQNTARALQEAVRMTDLVGRYGGEEFLIVLPSTGLVEAYILAERVRELVKEMTAASLAEPVTGSFGVVERQIDETVALVLHRVDGALYEAKRRGRNQVCAVGDLSTSLPLAASPESARILVPAPCLQSWVPLSAGPEQALMA